ncbi:MAG: glyoxalase [Planctomycetota bacterium]|nr:MAG: glyoxalase [Planctomycetota bacterium]
MGPTNPRPRVVGLDHVQVAIPPDGEEPARAFYGAVLGLREVPRPAPLSASGGLWFDCPGAMLHLGVESEFHPARKAHPAFLIAEMGVCRAALEEIGATARPADKLPGFARLHRWTRFGNRIELMERLS